MAKLRLFEAYTPEQIRKNAAAQKKWNAAKSRRAKLWHKHYNKEFPVEYYSINRSHERMMSDYVEFGIKPKKTSCDCIRHQEKTKGEW